MPSEALSQEPRDRGPPPVTRAGRSALLAKASTSPALERRSRGRPRKDGRSALPPSSPPPPPATKARKKGRSRGRAQAEDEESPDAAEKSPAHRPGSREKGSGRRRSTSRRKSNTKDSPEHSPAPSPEPGAVPSPEALPPPLDPGHDPPDSPPSAPPSPLPLETEEEEVGVAMEVSPAQTPVPSPCSSVSQTPSAPPDSPSPPPDSPSPLPDSPSPPPDSPSPLFERCLSDESGHSPTASIDDDHRRLTQCAFCLRGALSPLGQGPLLVFGPTPGYIPLHVLNLRSTPDRDNDCHDHVYRREEPACSSPEHSESVFEFLEQLGPFGLSSDAEVQSLFDPTGQCCAHLQCASWSDGVSRGGEGQSLLFVDKAIDSASTQACAFCRQLGASLRCRETDCGRSYHFPCAAAASTNQEWSQRVTWCSRHGHKRPLQCVRCSRGADVDLGGGLLMCCCCGDHYHGACLSPPLLPSPLSRAGWQCARCRVCRACGLREEGSLLLVCERCDKAYHPHCLSPALPDPPPTGWSCKNCRVCRRCGARSSGAWANHPSLCESCDPAQPCILCGDAPDLYSPQDHVTCICCYRSVHTECIVQAGEARLGAEGYTCTTCRPRADPPGPTSPHSPLATVAAPPVLTEEAPAISPSSHLSPVQQTFTESPDTRLQPHSPPALLQPSPRRETERPPSPHLSNPTQSNDRESPVRFKPDPTPEPSEIHESSSSASPHPPSNAEEISSQVEPSNIPEMHSPSSLSNSHDAHFDPESIHLQERLTISESHPSSPTNEEGSAPSHPPSPRLLRQPCPATENSEPSPPEPMEVGQNVSESNPSSPLPSQSASIERSQTPDQSEPTEAQEPLRNVETSKLSASSPASPELAVGPEVPQAATRSPIQPDIAASPASPPKDSQEEEESLQLDNAKLQESHTQTYLASPRHEQAAAQDEGEGMEEETTLAPSPTSSRQDSPSRLVPVEEEDRMEVDDALGSTLERELAEIQIQGSPKSQSEPQSPRSRNPSPVHQHLGKDPSPSQSPQIEARETQIKSVSSSPRSPGSPVVTSTLEEETPESLETEQDISTLDKDLSAAPCRSKPLSHALSISAPCSPTHNLARPPQCSSSQPASPRHVDVSQPVRPFELTIPVFDKVGIEKSDTSPMLHSIPEFESQTLEKLPSSPSPSALDLPEMPHQELAEEQPAQSSASPPPPSPLAHKPTPESLSTSAKHSSLPSSPRADRFGDSTRPPSSPVPDLNEAGSLSVTEMPASEGTASVGSPMQSGLASLASPQQEEMDVDIDRLKPQKAASPLHSSPSSPGESVRSESFVSSNHARAESPVEAPTSPSLTPASFSPPHCKSPEGSSDGISQSAAEIVHSPPRSSPAGLASPVSSQRRSFDGSPAHATEVSSPPASPLVKPDPDATLGLTLVQPRPVSPCNDEVSAPEMVADAAQASPRSPESLPDTLTVSPVSHVAASSLHLSPERPASPSPPKPPSPDLSPRPVSCPASPQPPSPTQDKTAMPHANEAEATLLLPVSPGPNVPVEEEASSVVSPDSSPKHEQSLPQSPPQPKAVSSPSPSRSKDDSVAASPVSSEVSAEISPVRDDPVKTELNTGDDQLPVCEEPLPVSRSESPQEEMEASEREAASSVDVAAAVEEPEEMEVERDEEEPMETEASPQQPDPQLIHEEEEKRGDGLRIDRTEEEPSERREDKEEGQQRLKRAEGTGEEHDEVEEHLLRTERADAEVEEHLQRAERVDEREREQDEVMEHLERTEKSAGMKEEEAMVEEHLQRIEKADAEVQEHLDRAERADKRKEEHSEVEKHLQRTEKSVQMKEEHFEVEKHLHRIEAGDSEAEKQLQRTEMADAEIEEHLQRTETSDRMEEKLAVVEHLQTTERAAERREGHAEVEEHLQSPEKADDEVEETLQKTERTVQMEEEDSEVEKHLYRIEGADSEVEQQPQRTEIADVEVEEHLQRTEVNVQMEEEHLNATEEREEDDLQRTDTPEQPFPPRSEEVQAEAEEVQAEAEEVQAEAEEVQAEAEEVQAEAEEVQAEAEEVQAEAEEVQAEAEEMDLQRMEERCLQEETSPREEPTEEEEEDLSPHSPPAGVQLTAVPTEDLHSPHLSSPHSPHSPPQSLPHSPHSPPQSLPHSPPQSLPYSPHSPPAPPSPSQQAAPSRSPKPPSPISALPRQPASPTAASLSPPRAGSLEDSSPAPSDSLRPQHLVDNQETPHISGAGKTTESEANDRAGESTRDLETRPTIDTELQEVQGADRVFEPAGRQDEDELLKESDVEDNSSSSMYIDTDQSRSPFGKDSKDERSEAWEEQEELPRVVNEKATAAEDEEEEMEPESMERREKIDQSDEEDLDEEFEIIDSDEVLQIQEEMMEELKSRREKDQEMKEISQNAALEEQLRVPVETCRKRDVVTQNLEKPELRTEDIGQLEKDHLDQESSIVDGAKLVQTEANTAEKEKDERLIVEWEKSPRNGQSEASILEVEEEEEEEEEERRDKMAVENEEIVVQKEEESSSGEWETREHSAETEELEESRDKLETVVDQSEPEESVERVELGEDEAAEKPQSPERSELDDEARSVEMCEDSQEKVDSDLEDAVSPVLDLDPSLDMEVMALMSSPPPSLLTLASPSPSPTLLLPRRGKGRSVLRSLQAGSRAAQDDLTARLRQSPFSTEASPENSPNRLPVTPPPLSPLTPPLRASPSSRESPPLSRPQIPQTVIPFTPKIGMGKPAITKRKFSPGRARARQCSWWSSRRAVSPPSSSQDSGDGWDSPKPRSQDSPLWGMKTGRGSGFPGRRRSRGGGIGSRGGRGRSRLKTQDCLTVSPGGGYMESFQMRDDEDNSMHNTVVMFSTSDHFTLKQDMCVVCGSFGQGEEGRLLACSQCGQCYHPYCVNVKITRVILTKGWRCLECTVCEACGEASDPGRLLLCDDCDISFHTYCLDPPLHTVPKGAWKCKWCVWCVQCGSTSPGLHCDWMNNYSLCGPCFSLSRCPLCQRPYAQDDLILQCQQCDRWVHAVCHGLMSEEEVESTADEGFNCSLCKNHGRGSYVRSDSFDSPYMAQIISRFREPDLKTYTQDGVCLTESGLSHLQSLVEPLTSPRRYRRNKPKLKLRIINQNSVSVLQTPEPETPTEHEPSRDLDCEMKSDSSPERDHPHEDYGLKEPETADGKKRKRKPYRPGIGGFMVRQRGGKGPSRIKLCRSDSTDTYPGRDDDGDAMDTSADHSMEKVKKRYRKKRTKLEETFPSYLQEAFFGRDLLDRSRLIDRRPGPEAPALGQSGPSPASGPAKGPAPVPHGHTPQKQRTLPVSEEALVDLSDVLNTDPHILATGQTGQFQCERSPSPFAGLDISSVDASRPQRSVQDETLDAILSPELDKMVSDGAILSKLYKIPELEMKDVEEVFTAVLSPNSSGQSEAPTGHKPHPPAPGAQFPRLPLMNGLMGSSSAHFPSSSPMMPLGAQATPRFRMAPPHPSGPAPPPPGPAHPSQPANQACSPAEEQDALSTAQRGMLKWEKEEPLGEHATVAPVLYCNIKFPQLKEQYPDWPSRMKQIAKLWRKASSQDRAPFVQKARDNRAAQRINKVQLPPDPLKRHAQPPPPPPVPYDPVSMETDMFKDPLRPKESEQEQEWKMRQGEVNERWGAGLKSPSHKDCPFQASVAGAGKEALQMRQKSKQLAKIEATQKLEQVKNEQLLQQRQQQLLTNQRLCGGVSPETGSRSPMTPGQQGAGASAADDVFLRPQAPPLSGFSPSSPQMFSPPSSRPSSPWDPYGKVVGTPRPPSAPQPPLQARRNSLSASPAHDALGSPAPSPDAKVAEISRNMAPQQQQPQAVPQTRPGMLSPSSLEHSRLSALRTDPYQRPVFKAPMPPHQQDFSGPRRDPTRPTDLGFPLNPPQDFPSSPLSGLGSPHRSPYSQAPGTPRPDYGQQMGDAYSHMSPLSSRPSPDPYSNPQTPGTPRFPRSPVGTPRPSPEAYTQGTDSFSGQGAAAAGSSPRAPGLSADANTFTPHHQRSPGRPQPQPQPQQQQQHTPKHSGISEESSSFTPHTPVHDPFEQSDKPPPPPSSSTSELSALGPDSLGIMPQMGDSEDKLRQRQRLRQLILRQQQQKSALRQEKGLQDQAPPLAPTQAPPTAGHMPQTAPGHAPVARHWPQDEPDPFGRPPPPYPGMRPVAPPPHGAQRFPPGLHPEQLRGFPPGDAGAFPRPMLVRPHLRFSVPPGAPGLQDSFMRAAQGPVPVAGLSGPEGVPVPLRRPVPPDFTGIRPLPVPSAHPHMLQGVQPGFMPRSVPVQPHPSHSIMGQPYIELRHRAPELRLRLPFPEQEVPRQPPPLASVELPVAVAMEEHLETEDSAVKDLEDVEVKDLVDLNLNLDPDDGKEDLDLAANDLHLDDFLLSGKFDLIAYTDPELNLDNEDLDLDPVDQDRKEHSGQSAASAQIKQEVKTEGRETQSQAPQPGHMVRAPAPGAGTAAGLNKEKAEGPSLQTPNQSAPMASGPQPVFLQRPLGPSSLVPPHPPGLQPRVVQSAVRTPSHSPSQSQSELLDSAKSRALLLEEQPLLLQDLLDQERQEQQQQKQMQALIRQRSGSEQPLPNMDFDSISDPIMKAKMVALKGINKFMAQGPLGMNPMVRLQQQQPATPSTVQEGAAPTPLPPAQDGKMNPQMVRPNPPTIGPGFVNEGQRRQYEEWLGETQRLLQMQQRLLEDQIASHRKTKKALSAKQRTAKKAGRPFAEEDAAQLRYVTEQQGAVQKQLEQIRKQQKDHTELIEDYRSKHQPRALQPGAPLVPPGAPPMAPSGPGLMQGPMGPLQHPQRLATAGPGAAGWSPAGGLAPGAMAQRMPPHIPPQMGPQPPKMGPQVPVQRPGFSAGPNGAAEAPTPQVKFDDNNPFSEGFQERERRERLQEQQERQRVQLMHEVERHRALQQRLELEHQGMMGSRPTPPSNPPSDGLSQMPFFSSELPQDFLQSPPSRPPAPSPHLPVHLRHPAPSHATQRFGHDSASSSPSTPRPPAPLHPLYDAAPDDKKKPRRKQRDGEGGDRTPLSSHSDDLTAPPTPAMSTCSTPTRPSADQSELFSLAPSSELERQLSAQEAHRGVTAGGRLEVKEERVEAGSCSGGVKTEDSETTGDAGKELLRHLLKEKSPSATPPHAAHAPHAPPAAQPPPPPHGGAVRQMSVDSVRSEEEDSFLNSSGRVDSPGGDVDKKARFKRLNRPDKDRPQPKNKRRKRDDDEVLHSNTTGSEAIMTHIRQLSVLPLMEPVLRVDLSLFPPYGSSSLGSDSRLSGSFGNACLDGVTDYYSQLIYKQNNLSNPPTPPASLPPTPPPVARQKLVNGFATTEELARKELAEQEVKAVSNLKQKGEELLSLNHASKTVDVPASLPTPPHNNQEEIRGHFLSESLSPEEYVPSSSPESVADSEISRYPNLSFIKLEPPSPCPSPTIPIMPCAWGKGSALKQEVKSEPNLQAPPSCSNTDLVTISVTLNPLAAQNVPGVMAAVAQLLRLPVPLDYQLHRAGPERSNLALLAGVRVPMMQGPGMVRAQRPPAPANSVRMDLQPPRPHSCGFCKVPLGNGVRIVKQEGQSRPGAALVFCSSSCSAQYSANPQNSNANKLASPPPGKTQHHYANNMSSIAVHTLPLRPPPCSGPAPSPPLSFPPASAIAMETRRTDSLKVKVKLKPRPRAVPGGEELRHGKRSKSSRWRRWSVSVTLSRGPCVAPEPLSEEEVRSLGSCLRPDPLPKDLRRCCFCAKNGDGDTDGPARLLNLDLDLWVHLNCALWSSEVYETQAGALINVELALRRGLTLRCAHCQQTGATSGCNRLRCTNTYHFTCALQAQCTFFKDKTMLCHLHKPRSLALSPSSSPFDPAAPCDPYDSELRCFAVFRRVYVQRDEARQIAAVVQRGERQHTFRVGSLLFRAVGRLLPSQLQAFHNSASIWPVGYHANRLYWSMRHHHRRCKYQCYIEEKDAQPLFKIKVVEKGHDDLVLTGLSPKAVWEQVLEPVAQLRTTSGCLKLFPVYLKGEDLFGLTSSAVTRIIESLPGVEGCERYSFRFGKNPLMEWPLAFNPTGSARSEPKALQAKRPFLLTSVATRCQGSVGSIVGLVPGQLSLSPGETVAGAHQGRHSKSAQYRRMTAEWKSNVYLARSRIQGLGLYAARDIEKCTMVIEYIGTIIRSEVANRKERLYESQNRGVYMFRIDNDYVIDATITGGPARYINHSCAPNCITEVVTIEKENKIIISSCRRIQRGEELSYDYKFDFEDDQHKIPCHCGAVNCRKWMN